MVVAEGKIDVRMARRPAEHRQAVRRRRTMAHPFLAAAGIQARQKMLRQGDQLFCALVVRRCTDFCELRRANDPNLTVDW